MNWFTQLSDVLKLLPAIITAIKAIEEAIPGSGKGRGKAGRHPGNYGSG
jgi:hypothetical protein